MTPKMKASRPTVADLERGAAFELFETIDHVSVHRWTRQHLFSLSWVTASYWLINLLALGVVGLIWHGTSLPLLDGFSKLCLGMVLGWVVLLPIHEHLHALAYRFVGAPSVSVRYELRRMTALCVAPGQVVGSPDFALVCLAPLAVLNPVLAVLTFAPPTGPLALMFSGALLAHTGACSGDVSFLQFLWSQRRHRVFTFDDINRQLTYFYRAKAPVA